MFGGTIIINFFKSALGLLGKGVRLVGSAARWAINTKAAKFVGKTVSNFGTKMLKNVQTKRWWGRAVRVIRTSRSMLGAVGAIGAALKKQGGLLGLFGRGLSIFNTDYRSPKEFRKDMKTHEKNLKSLKGKRDALIKKELETQKELKAPVITEGLETSGEKIDELAKHLSQMKVALSEVKASSFSTSTNVKGFETYQIKANEQLADAITHGTETNMKSLLSGLEDVKDNTNAVTMSATESIVGDISSKIDAIEEQRKEEEEFRRKNDWKRKLINGILFLADWILNFPYKIGMLLLKITALAAGAIAIMLLPHLNKINAMIWAFKNGFSGAVLSIIALKLAQFGSWLLEKIGIGVKWIMKNLIKGLFSIQIFIAKIWSKILPFDFMKKPVSFLESQRDGVIDTVSSLYDKAIGFAKYAKEDASKKSAEILDSLEKLYNSTKKDPKRREVSPDDLEKKSQSQLFSDETKANESSNETPNPQVSSSQTGEKEKEDRGLLGKVGSFAKNTVVSGFEKAEKLYDENDVDKKLSRAKDVVTNTTTKLKVTASEIISDNELKSRAGKLAKKTDEGIDKLSKEVSELKEVVKDGLYGKPQASNSPSTINKGTSVNFKESANQYENMVQKS